MPTMPWTRIKTGISISANDQYPTILADQKALAVDCEGAASVAFLIGCETAALIDGTPPFNAGYFVPDDLYEDFPVVPGGPMLLKSGGIELANAYQLAGNIQGAIHDIASKPRILLIRGVGRTPIPVRSIYPILKVGPIAQSSIFVNARVYG